MSSTSNEHAEEAVAMEWDGAEESKADGKAAAAANRQGMPEAPELAPMLKHLSSCRRMG